MAFALSDEIKQLAQYRHVKVVAKALKLEPEHVAALEAIKAALMTGLQYGVSRKHEQMLLYMLMSEPAMNAFRSILEMCGKDLKNHGVIRKSTIDAIYKELGIFESIPSFNRNKVLAVFLDLLGKKVFIPKPEELKDVSFEVQEVKKAIQELRSELSTIREMFKEIKALVR